MTAYTRDYYVLDFDGVLCGLSCQAQSQGYCNAFGQFLASMDGRRVRCAKCRAWQAEVDAGRKIAEAKEAQHKLGWEA